MITREMNKNTPSTIAATTQPDGELFLGFALYIDVVVLLISMKESQDLLPSKSLPQLNMLTLEELFIEI